MDEAVPWSHAGFDGRDWCSGSQVKPSHVPQAGMFGGGCGLRTSGGLSAADGAESLLLVVWPGAFQHWSLNPVVWDLGPVPVCQNSNL